MKKQIYISISIYLLIFLLLIFVVYGFFSQEIELNIVNFLLLLLPLSFAFFLNYYILKQKFEVDENLLHLTKEILHELAIPISTIQANTQLLKRGVEKDEKSLKRLNRIEDSTKRLERLYDELIYSIKKEIKSVEREEIRLRELVEERVSSMRLLHRNSFSLKLEDRIIRVDKIGFEKIFDNILTNAMKYSEKSSSIKITFKEQILSIEDSGIGMDEMELLGVYERYYQLDNSKRGEGIGLALVKAYCDDEQIKIKIHSVKGEGTKVSLDLSALVV